MNEIKSIKLTDLVSAPNNPFKITMDAEMERLIEELDRTKAQGNEAEKTVQKLKNQIKQLKQEQSREPSLGSNHNALAKLLSETSIQRLAREMSETQDRLKTMYAEPSATKSLKEFIDAMNKYNK